MNRIYEDQSLPSLQLGIQFNFPDIDMAGNRSTGKGKKADSNDCGHEEITYEKIMGIESSGDGNQQQGGGVEALSKRLVCFRKW